MKYTRVKTSRDTSKNVTPQMDGKVCEVSGGLVQRKLFGGDLITNLDPKSCNEFDMLFNK
jgi:hypothetical protein